MKQFAAERVNAAEAELNRVRGDWLRRPGVTAVDVGFRFVEGRMLDELAVRVHVKRKLPEDELPPGEVFPKNLGEFPVDVIEAEYAPQQTAETTTREAAGPVASAPEPLEPEAVDGGEAAAEAEPSEPDRGR